MFTAFLNYSVWGCTLPFTNNIASLSNFDLNQIKSLNSWLNRQSLGRLLRKIQ